MVKFEKISLEEYINYFKSVCPEGYSINEEVVAQEYDKIMLPSRLTMGSSGYNIYTPVDIKLSRYDSAFVAVPTGIKLVTNRNDIALFVLPNSAFGYNNNFELSETVCLVDADAHRGDFEGHIVVKVRASENTVIPAGAPFLTGVITTTLLVDDDQCDCVRIKSFITETSQVAVEDMSENVPVQDNTQENVDG